MSSAARRRLVRDFRRLQNDPPQGVTGAPMDSNILVSSARALDGGKVVLCLTRAGRTFSPSSPQVWQAVILGPDDTPWEGGTFKLLLEFSEDYPNKAPSVRFLTKMFHPNIYNDGQICLGGSSRRTRGSRPRLSPC